VADQAAIGGVGARRIDCRHGMQRRQRDNFSSPFKEERIVADKKRISVSLHERHEWLVEASLLVDVQDKRLHPNGMRRRLYSRLLGSPVRIIGIDEHGDERGLRYELA